MLVKLKTDTELRLAPGLDAEVIAAGTVIDLPIIAAETLCAVGKAAKATAEDVAADAAAHAKPAGRRK